MSAEYYCEEFDDNDIAENKALVILITIFPILFFIPLLFNNNSRYVRHYVNQVINYIIWDSIISFLLTIFIIILTHGTMLTSLSLKSGIPALSALGITLLASLIINIFFFICKIINIVNAARGSNQKMPLIGKLNIIK